MPHSVNHFILDSKENRRGKATCSTGLIVPYECPYHSRIGMKHSTILSVHDGERLDNMLAMPYNVHMDNKEKYSHMRVLRTTQTNLKIAAAFAHKSGLELLDELVQKELDRLEKERGRDAQKL